MDNTDCAINKKVIIAIPCLMRGGTEMQTLLFVRALVALEYDVEVCCYFEYDQLVVTEFKASGAKIQLLGWTRTLGTIAFIQALAKIFREKSPDMVHVQYMAPGLLPIIAARLARCPVILATVHYPGTSHGFVAHLLLRFGAFLTDCFTCVSEAAAKSWFGDSFMFDPAKPAHKKSRSHFTIPNAVDIDSLDKAIKSESPQVLKIAHALKNKRVVGTVARISHEKGMDILIEAFAILKKTIPDSHLLIVGEGNQMEKLKATGRHLKINDAITWTGKLSWTEAMGCLGIMDVVVVPSRFEGFGLTAVEAMACAKPVVASRVDGLSEIIQDGVNGFLSDTEDVKGFAERIIALLKNEAQRKQIGEAARQHVEEKYAYPMFRERISALYEMLEKVRFK